MDKNGLHATWESELDVASNKKHRLNASRLLMLRRLPACLRGQSPMMLPKSCMNPSFLFLSLNAGKAFAGDVPDAL